MPSPIYDLIETPLSGTMQQYKKVTTGGIINPEDGVPSIYFNESLVTILPDGTKTIKDNIGVLSVPYVPNEQIPILDQNGNITAYITSDYLYQIIASLYYFKATQRDSQ